MTLSWVVWKNEARIQRAEDSKPSIKFGESGQPVHLLQAALVLNGFDIPLHGVNGRPPRQQNNFGPGTQAAVRQCEQRFGLSRDGGVAGREVISRLDQDSNTFYTTHAGHFGAALARADTSLAIGKITSSLLGLALLSAGVLPASVTPLLDDALRVHFRLLSPGSASDGFRRARTAADLVTITRTFTALAAILNAGATSFEDGIPFNGVKTAASVTGSGIIRFGPFYRDFDAPFGALIGPNSRAAIVIHEGTHSVDGTGRSGNDDVHISEFDARYDRQSAELSLLNPSSYAGFAAHIANNGDPTPRFGLGAGRNR